MVDIYLSRKIEMMQCGGSLARECDEANYLVIFACYAAHARVLIVENV